MQVKEIMSKNVVTVEPKITIHNAAKKMTENNVKFLIVTEKERLIGIVTEWDFVRKIATSTKDVLDEKLEDIITKKVIVIKPETEVGEAAEIMSSNNIKRLPVVDNNVLIGVVTAMEIMAAEPKLIERVSELFMAAKKEPKSSVAG